MCVCVLRAAQARSEFGKSGCLKQAVTWTCVTEAGRQTCHSMFGARAL